MNRRRFFLTLTLSLAGLALALFNTGCRTATLPKAGEAWRGLHVPVFSDEQLADLERKLPALAGAGVNVVVLQVDYHFDFHSHPELRGRTFITRAQAREFARAAHHLGIRVIPELDCLGHQSLSSTTAPLLVHYPQFDETPGRFPNNRGIYCRSWCPQSPGLNQIVYALIDELVDAFQANAFHVGMDEVFIIADEHCPRCQGENPAQLFAQQVNALHHHIVEDRQWTMLMWADRLLEAKTMGYGHWESATNGTAAAVDLIPKDIILCDWHYRAQTNYPSVPFLLEKGFHIWPCGFQPVVASRTFSRSSLAQRQDDPRVIGFLCSTWSWARKVDISTWPPITEILPDWEK